MFSIKELNKVHSIDEAILLNSKKFNRVIGGGLWMRLGKQRIGTGIDLSGLGLNQIEEYNDYFKMGAMVSLRQLETNVALNTYFQNVFKEGLAGIIGVQFRNGATLGGSVYGRFGFSDVITILLSLGASVILDKEEEVTLGEYVTLKKDNRIVTHIILPKLEQKIIYKSVRKESVDLPVLNVSVVRQQGQCCITVGARPQVATLRVLSDKKIEEILERKEDFSFLLEDMTFGTNTRGSQEYRKYLAGVLIQRGIEVLY